MVLANEISKLSIERKLSNLKNKYDYYVKSFDCRNLNQVDTFQILKQ